MPANIIEIKNIYKLFSEELKQGVFNASFSVKKGEIICILGSSGAGKSTLLRMIAGLEKCDKGKINYNSGINNSGNFIYVPQDYTLWPHLTILENLTLAPIKVKKINKDIAEKEAIKLLNKFGLKNYSKSYTKKLSGGQKQRVALLQAIMMKPDLLMLDEITSALDPELTKSVLDMIRFLAKDGYTMLVVTHHISLALSIADRVIFLRDGKIVQESSALQFFNEQSDQKILSFIKDVSKLDHVVEIFEGKEQFQTYHLNLLKRLPKNSTIYVAGSVGDRWYTPMGDLYDSYEKLRIKKSIKWKMAMYELGEKDKQLILKYPQLNEFRELPRTLQNPANYNIMEDGMVIIQIFSKKPTILEIKDPLVAEAYLKFFEEMWNISKPYKL